MRMVEWDRRELNIVALDIGEGWVRRDTEAMREAKYSLANEAAGGLAVFAYYLSGRRILLLRVGKPFGTLGSTFLAEALALEWCLLMFRRL